LPGFCVQKGGENWGEYAGDNRGWGKSIGSVAQAAATRTLYRGDPGMWSWVLHRISGATIFFFLFVHVLDAAMLRVSPQTYNAVVGDYKTPIVGLMEFGLVAAVLFHALNGIRVILIDFWADGTRYQRLMLWIVGITYLLLMVPVGVVLAIHMMGHFR